MGDWLGKNKKVNVGEEVEEHTHSWNWELARQMEEKTEESGLVDDREDSFWKQD